MGSQGKRNPIHKCFVCRDLHIVQLYDEFTLVSVDIKFNVKVFPKVLVIKSKMFNVTTKDLRYHF